MKNIVKTLFMMIAMLLMTNLLVSCGDDSGSSSQTRSQPSLSTPDHNQTQELNALKARVLALEKGQKNDAV